MTTLSPPEPPPTFAEPWQAQAFALAVHMRDRGLIAWPDFSAALAQEIAAAGEAYSPDHYYDCWLDALERLLVAKGQVDPQALHALEHAWADAYRRTPHGKPVVL
jgi:nitrile hydratase accessory protein